VSFAVPRGSHRHKKEGTSLRGITQFRDRFLLLVAFCAWIGAEEGASTPRIKNPRALELILADSPHDFPVVRRCPPPLAS